MLPPPVGDQGGAETRSPFADLLELPWHDELRHLDRGLCAELVDARLRVLARREALARRVLGAVGAVFLRIRAHQRLGFVRLNDYARERLGLSARELQSVAKVTAELSRLPALAAAFERGELSWTHVRILGDVATPASEEAWLDAARGRAVRALEDLVHEAPDGVGSVAIAATPIARAASSVAADDPDADTLDGEPIVRFRLLCPRGLRPLWRAAVELARRVAGAPLSVWRAAEAIAAEGLSGAEAPPEDRSPSAPSVHRAVPASSGVGMDARETVPTTDVSALSAHDAAMLSVSFPPIEPLADDLDGLDAFALDERMREVVAALRTVDWEIGRLLRLFFDLRLHKMLGFPNSGSSSASGSASRRGRQGRWSRSSAPPGARRRLPRRIRPVGSHGFEPSSSSRFCASRRRRRGSHAAPR